MIDSKSFMEYMSMVSLESPAVGLLIQVIAYSGYKGNERPCSFLIDGHLYDIEEVLKSWCETYRTCFKVVTTDGKLLVLRYTANVDEWTVGSEFDGSDLMSRPNIELIAVDTETVRKAESMMESCEQCHPDDADIPLDWLLAEVTGKEGRYDFVMPEFARCPTCRRFVSEGTLVERKD
jgi:hypothetical protein